MYNLNLLTVSYLPKSIDAFLSIFESMDRFVPS